MLNNSSKKFSYNRENRKNTTDNKRDSVKKDNVNSYAHAVRGWSQVNREVDNNPTIVLDDACVNQKDCICCMNVKVKDFGSLSNLKVVLGNEDFDEIELRYLGCLWVMIEFKSVEVKDKFQSNVGKGSWFSKLIQASKDFTIDGRVTWVEIEGYTIKSMD